MQRDKKRERGLGQDCHHKSLTKIDIVNVCFRSFIAALKNHHAHTHTHTRREHRLIAAGISYSLSKDWHGTRTHWEPLHNRRLTIDFRT